MSYVDGFIIPIATKNLAAYRRVARIACKVWMDHGAVDYKECVGDDLKPSFGVPFTKISAAKKGETVVFAYIVYKSRKHRDQVNAKVMQDPRLAKLMKPGAMPFDMKRLSYGGFKTIVGDSR
ncbi:MAG: DUF1428 domain-containing protein [Phycisphaerae bacterium]|nr:DUF1428 domain-containing protein [Phycisphaerae bacterium]